MIVQDIINRLNPLLSNFTTGSIDITSRLAAINSAVEYLKRYMTFPSDEVKQSFLYYEDTPYITINTDFNEGLAVRYDTDDQNHERKAWNYAPYLDLLQKIGDKYPRTNWFSWMPINGFWQLVMYGRNRNHGQTYQTFDQITGLSVLNDTQNPRIDINIVKEGAGSLAFDINPSLGNGLASVQWTAQNDFTKEFNNNGVFKVYVWLASTNLSAINLRLITDSTDYFVLPATTFDDSTAFSTGLDQWKRVQFSFANSTTVGSPNIKNITAIRIDFVESGFGGSTIPNFRVDQFYSVFPDNMDLIYLTSYKGTDTLGTTKKQFFDQASDIPSFGLFTPDIIDIVAYRAAVILVPQLMSNADFRKMYKEEVSEQLMIIGKSWPRKRVMNLGSLKLLRSR